MSQSPITVTYSLEEALKQINDKLDTLSKDVNDLKVGQARLEERFDGFEKRFDEKIDGLEKRLETRMDGLDKRLGNQEFVSRGILIALIVTILGGFAKLFGFTP